MSIREATASGLAKYIETTTDQKSEIEVTWVRVSEVSRKQKKGVREQV